MSFADLKFERRARTSTSPSSASATAVRDGVAGNTEGLYPQLPPSLEIRRTDHSGRGLWARRHFRPGSVVLSVQPHVFTLSNQFLDLHCSSCANTASTPNLMRCSGCRTTRYCNASCQKADWKSHKPECTALQRWANSAPSAALGVPSDAVRCLGRILWKMRSSGLDSDWSREIQEMQYHKVSPQEPASVEAHTHLAHSVVRYLGLTAPSDLEEYGIMSAGDLARMVSQFVTNTFALTSPPLTPIGVTVSPLAALTNHSCVPNAVVVFPRSGKGKMKEPVVSIVALRDIQAAEEVSIAYIDTTLPKAQRQKALSETYKFTCQCPLCTRPATVCDPRETVLCPKSCGGTCPLPNEDNRASRCSTCKSAITDPDAVIDSIRIGQEALDKATRLQSSDADKAKHLTGHMIPILVSARVPPSCHPLLALLTLHQSLLVSSLSDGVSREHLDECIRTAAKRVAGLSAVLEEGHPVRGVALAELGKLLAVDEPSPPPQTTAPSAATSTSFPPNGPARLKMAYETLLKARDALLIGFGRENEGGEVGREVRESLVALEKELGVWATGVRNVLEDTPTSARKKT